MGSDYGECEAGVSSVVRAFDGSPTARPFYSVSAAKQPMTMISTTSRRILNSCISNDRSR